MSLCVCALAALIAGTAVAAAAGGSVAGRVVDAKGAAVVGASVTVVASETAAPGAAPSPRAVTTDAERRFKIAGLAPGDYVVTVTANGFAEGRLPGVKVEEGKGASVEVGLEVARVEGGSVTVSAAGGIRANSDPVYQGLRQQASAPQDFAGGDVVSVSNVVLKRVAVGAMNDVLATEVENVRK